MTNPLASIVTLCFNHAPFLDEYLCGLESQTYAPLQLIIVDDQSTDGSWERLRAALPSLQRKFEDVQLLQNPTNSGFFEGLARAVPLVRGQYFSILESDDALKPLKTARSVEFLESNPGLVAVHSDVELAKHPADHQRTRRWQSSQRHIPEGDIYEALLHENFILTCAFTCRTAALRAFVDFGRYRDRGYVAADYPMFLDLARHAPFGYIDDALAVYRVRAGSASRPIGEIASARWLVEYYRIKVDFVDAFGASATTTLRARSQFHRAERQLAWLQGDLVRLREAATAVDRLGCERRTAGRILRAYASKSRTTWRLARALERIRSRLWISR